MSKELLLPVTAEHYEIDGCTLDKTMFTDGSVVNKLRFGDDPDAMLIIHDGQDQIDELPGMNRYPYSERLARIAVEQFNETGELVLWQV